MSESKNAAREFYPAPGSEDGILKFNIDPVFLDSFAVDNAFHRESGINAVFTTVVNGGNAAQALLPGQMYEHFVRVRKLTNQSGSPPLTTPQVTALRATNQAVRSGLSWCPWKFV